MSISAFLRKPFVQQGLRVFAIMGVGDIIAQTLVEKKSLRDLDLKRTFKFSSVGLFFIGPSLHFWYGFLEKSISPNQSVYKRGFKKMAVDQFLFAPVFCAAVIAIMGVVNRESNKDILERLKYDYPDIMIRMYMLWPPAQIINFSIVPLQHQVTFAQLVAVVWNIYMSLVLNKKVHTEPVSVSQ